MKSLQYSLWSLLFKAAVTLTLFSTQLSAQLKILPLGDSITVGEVRSAGWTSPRGGYRWRLEDRLQADAYNFDFIGSIYHQGIADDGDHEGHGGWTIDQINNLVSNSSYITQADIVLLMIGTNDLVPSGFADMNSLNGKLSNLINNIKNLNDDAKIIVSTVPNSEGAAEGWNGILGGEVDAYNQEVRNVVDTLAWRDVTLVDGQTWIWWNLDDGVHPDQKGEKKLGDAFFTGVNRDHWDLTYQHSNDGAGWWISPYFGDVYHGSSTVHANWKYLPKLGWVWANKSIKGGIWLWHQGLNSWLRTDRKQYPWFYQQSTGDWLHLNENSTETNRWMWNHTTQQWMNLP